MDTPLLFNLFQGSEKNPEPVTQKRGRNIIIRLIVFSSSILHGENLRKIIKTFLRIRICSFFFKDQIRIVLKGKIDIFQKYKASK